MEGITLGDLSNGLVFIAGILASGGTVIVFLSKYLRKIIKEMLNPLEKKMDDVSSTVSQVDMDNCKNYLVSTISTLEAGRTVDKVALERFWENYDHYTQNGGNSYIHTAVERLKKENKL